MAKKENESADRILNAVAGRAKMHRVQCGEWWASRGQGCPLYRMRGARAGVSDYCGWRKVIVTHEMVGKPLAQFVALEVKTKTGKEGEAQANFIRALKEDGGVAGICRTPDDALDLLK